MPNRPYTDVHEIVKNEVANHMRPFIEVNMYEHEQTRNAIRENTKILRSVGQNRTHSAINSVLIGVLSVLMILLLTGC